MTWPLVAGLACLGVGWVVAVERNFVIGSVIGFLALVFLVFFVGG